MNKFIVIQYNNVYVIMNKYTQTTKRGAQFLQFYILTPDA